MIWPFENDTGWVEWKLAARSLAANKRRNLLTGIIILAASFLLSFAVILLCNATIDTQILSRVDNTRETVGAIFGIAVVLLFTAGIAIKNIMYISVLQRTREFARLRTIGATCRQIRAVLHKERKMLCRKYILGGLALGFFCNGMLPLRFYWMPSLACTLLSGSFVWFIIFLSFHTPVRLAASLSPMEMMRAEGTGRSAGSAKNVPITPNSLAKKYFLSSRKKAVYTLASFILSGTLMFVGFSVVSAVRIKEIVRQSYQADSSIYLILNSTADEHSTYELMKNSPFTEELKTQIERIPGVTDIHPAKMLDCERMVPGQPEHKYEGSINSIVDASGFEKQLVEGEMPHFQASGGAAPVVINRASPYYEKTGLDLKMGDHFSMEVNTGRSVKEVTFSLCGFIENKDTGGVFYMLPESLDRLAEINCDVVWYICTEGDQGAEKIKELAASDDRLVISVFSEDLAEYQAYFRNAKVIVMVCMTLIGLFAFINLLNTCITNTILRLHDYALLEAAGMTKKQIRQTQTAENRIYFFGGLTGSCVLGIGSGIFLCNKIAGIPGLSYISYKFPWSFLILYIMFVLAAHVIVTAYQKRILMKQSVTERMKAGI